MNQPGHKCRFQIHPDSNMEKLTFVLICECGFTDTSTEVVWHGDGPAWKHNMDSNDPDLRIQDHHGFQYVRKQWVEPEAHQNLELPRTFAEYPDIVYQTGISPDSLARTQHP